MNSQAVWYPTFISPGAATLEVSWVDMSGVDFREAFFHQTVSKVRDRASMLLPLGKTPQATHPPLARPSGFIFHVSRCGSTLLCNLLRTLPAAHVAAEPQPLSFLLTTLPNAVPDFPVPAAWRQQDECIFSLMQWLGQHPAEEKASRFVVKFTSYCAVRMNIIRRLWPDVPIVFLVRDPVEVMMSNLARIPRWMQLRQRPRRAQELFGWFDARSDMPDEEFLARVFGSLCISAKEVLGSADLVMDYSELVRGGWVRVFQTFGLGDPGKEQMPAIESALATYSKASLPAEVFQADGKRKRSMASDSVVEAANRWAVPHLQDLLQRDAKSA